MTNKEKQLLGQATKAINEAYSVSFNEDIRLIRDTLEDFVVNGVYRPRRGKYEKTRAS